jgi:hypothetical protein
LRRSTTELTNDRACRIRRNDDEFGYLHNATEALAELMMSLQRRSSPEAGPAVTCAHVGHRLEFEHVVTKPFGLL